MVEVGIGIYSEYTKNGGCQCTLERKGVLLGTPGNPPYINAINQGGPPSYIDAVTQASPPPSSPPPLPIQALKIFLFRGLLSCDLSASLMPDFQPCFYVSGLKIDVIIEILSS